MHLCVGTKIKFTGHHYSDPVCMAPQQTEHLQVGEAKRVLIQSGQVSGDENSSVADVMAGLAISA